MLLRTEVTHATDLDLLTVLIGDRRKATQLFAKASFSLFAGLLCRYAHQRAGCASLGRRGLQEQRCPGSARSSAARGKGDEGGDRKAPRAVGACAPVSGEPSRVYPIEGRADISRPG